MGCVRWRVGCPCCHKTIALLVGRMTVDLEKVREYFGYDPSTGEFRWIKNKKKGRIGALAGEIVATTGYRRICFDGKRVFAHRLAYAWMTGEWPETVDHINRVRTDNRWENLRSATRSQQQGNARGAGKTRGVYQDRGRKMWRARLTRRHGGNINVGTYATKEEAQEAFDAVAVQHFGEFYTPPMT